MTEEEPRGNGQKSYFSRSMFVIALLLLWWSDFDVFSVAATIDATISGPAGYQPSERSTASIALVIYVGIAGWGVLALIEWLSGGRVTLN